MRGSTGYCPCAAGDKPPTLQLTWHVHRLQFGTHNRCLGMEDGIYLEVIAVDPEAPPPSRPRWFGLDDPSMQVGAGEGCWPNDGDW